MLRVKVPGTTFCFDKNPMWAEPGLDPYSIWLADANTLVAPCLHRSFAIGGGG